MLTAVFIPCYIHQLKPTIGIKMIQVLEALGCEVEVLTEAFCCGQPAFNAGFQKESKPVVDHFLTASEKFDKVIIPSASCAGFLKNYAPKLFADDNEKSLLIKNANEKVMEFGDFIMQYLDIKKLEIHFPHAVAYHTSCAALREYKCTNATLEILQHITNLNILPFDASDACCGFGGSFAEKFADISISMANYKLEKFQEKNIQYVVSNDYSCLLHLESVAKKNGNPISFLHLAEILMPD